MSQTLRTSTEFSQRLSNSSQSQDIKPRPAPHCTCCHLTNDREALSVYSERFISTVVRWRHFILTSSPRLSAHELGCLTPPPRQTDRQTDIERSSGLTWVDTCGDLCQVLGSRRGTQPVTSRRTDQISSDNYYTQTHTHQHTPKRGITRPGSSKAAIGRSAVYHTDQSRL